VSQFRIENTNLLSLDIDGVVLNKPHDTAEAFSNHFQSVYGRFRFANVTLTSYFNLHCLNSYKTTVTIEISRT
jgi:hypothetical protein